ncbi:MAG: Lrp/AsnC family transcriptional regulator [Pseudomonadota bacterium]
MDAFDLKILLELQRDAKLTNQALAERVGLSPSPCLRRVQRLQKDGVLTAYRAHIRRQAVGLQVMAFVHVSLQDHLPETLDRFKRFVSTSNAILECHSLSGRYDYLLKVVASNVEQFDEVLTRGLLAGIGVNAANTSFVLKQLKSTTELPLDEANLV